MIALDTRVLAIALACLASSVGCSGGGGGLPTSFSDGTSGIDAGAEASGGQGGPGAGSGSSSGSSSSGNTGGSSGSSGSGSSSSGGSGTSSGASSGSSSGDAGGSGGAKGDGGALWSPTTGAPIHFHWMIGGFTTADILPNQAGTVVYDIDGENSTAADVAAIHAAGATAVCYVDVGTVEKGRSDYSKFPSSVVGPAVAGWPGENWLLVSAANQAVILPLMKARFADWCQAKGFDAIEPDNLDGSSNISNISQADDLSYVLAISQLAHALPLSIGLKNLATSLSASQLPMFVGAFEWALNEQCYEYNECAAYTQSGSFLPAGKAVFDVEYNTSPNCTQANQSHINAQLTDLDLVGATASGYKYTPCVPDNQATW
jgi:Glycoside-hydrolase family GH114